MSKQRPEMDYRAIQMWVQDVVMDREGVAHADQQMAKADKPRIDEVIEGSATLSPEQRIGVYAKMYYARLVDSLCEDFPGVYHALGSEAFCEMAEAYLSKFPSTHYCMTKLGDRLPGYLANHEDQYEYGRFLVELATLEVWHYQLFHEPGDQPLAMDAVLGLDAQTLMQSRLKIAETTQLMFTEYPVGDYLKQVHDQATPQVPEKTLTWLMVYRNGYYVDHDTLAEPAAVLIQKLKNGETFGDAVNAAAEIDLEQVSADVGAWLQDWAAKGLICGIE